MTEPREGTKIVCPHCKETLEIVGMVPEADRDQLRERLGRWEAWWVEGNGTLPGPYGEITLSPPEDSTP